MAPKVYLQGLLIAFLVLQPAIVHTGMCLHPNAPVESPYHYMVNLVDALSYGKSALDRFKKSPAERGVADYYDLLYGLKLGIAHFECAASQVRPYLRSSNEAIEGSAEGVAVVFLKLADLHQQSVEEYKTLLDSVDEKSLKLGTFIDKQAQRGADYDATWKLLVTAVILGTYAIVEADPTTGLMSGLALTPAERDQILAKLRSTFGQQVTGGIQAG